MRLLFGVFATWFVWAGAASALEPPHEGDWKPSRAQVEELERGFSLSPCPASLSAYIRNYVGRSDAQHRVILGYYRLPSKYDPPFLRARDPGIYIGLPEVIAASDLGCGFITVEYDPDSRFYIHTKCSNYRNSAGACRPYFLGPLVTAPPVLARPPQ
jgi:hypothetical protein